MRAIIRIDAEPQASWEGQDWSTAKDSRCFTYYVLNKIKEALPEYASMIVVAGVEDTPGEAHANVRQSWVWAD